MRSAVDIVSLYNERVRALGPVHQRMRKVRDLVDTDIVIPVSELDRLQTNGAANLLLQGLEQMSMRVGSVAPPPYFPPIRSSMAAKERARKRRDAMPAAHATAGTTNDERERPTPRGDRPSLRGSAAATAGA